MFIGIAPGEDEDIQGRPFVGVSGQLLRKTLEKVGIPESECYFTNVVKCRLLDKFKRNRNPTPEEMKLCGRFVLKEINEVKPSLIVILGEPPLKYFFNKKLSSVRGLVLPKGDYKFFITFHPAHITREKAGSTDTKLFERDFQSIYNFYYGVKKELENVEKFVCKTQEEVDQRLNGLENYEKVAFDLETFAPGTKKEKKALDPRAEGFKVLMASFSYKINGLRKAFCIPLEHPESPFEFSTALESLKKYFKKCKNKLVGQNIKWDFNVLQVRFGVDVDSVYFDTLPAHAILVGKRGHGLERMSVDYLGIDSYKHVLKENRGSELIPLSQLADMNMDDCIYTLELAEIFEKQLKDEDLWSYYTRVITPGIPVLKRMEVRGMKVDTEYCKSLENDINKNIAEIETRLKLWPEVGDLNLDSNKDLQTLFFERFKFQPGRKTKTGYSTDKDEVERMFEETNHPFLADLVDYRMLGKLKSTYVDPYLGGHVKCDGRVHGQFNQHIAITGRLSMEKPNLQNLPVRIGPLILKMFICDPGWNLVLADYNQIELRVLAAAAKDPKMIEAFKTGLDIHRSTAAWRFKVGYDEVTAEQRQEAKSTNFGIVYGQTAQGLAAELGIPINEAQVSIDEYLGVFEGVKDYMSRQIAHYKQYGYVRTLFGRKIYIRGPDESHNERRAINGPIQGTASDINVVAGLIETDRYFREEKLRSGGVNTIHDSGVFEVPDEEMSFVPDRIKEIMEGYQFDFMDDIPLKVDISIGHNLGEAKG